MATTDHGLPVKMDRPRGSRPGRTTSVTDEAIEQIRQQRGCRGRARRLHPDLLLESTRFVAHLLGGKTVVELFEVRRILEPVEPDSAFHAVIAEAAGNSVLSSLLESLSTRTLRARIWRGRLEAAALDATRAEHSRIYEAIAARDPELARTLAAAHVANSEHWLRADLARLEAEGQDTSGLAG